MDPGDGDDQLRLPERECLALAESAWVSVADVKNLGILDEHKAILKNRLADYRSGKSKPYVALQN